MSFRNTLRPSLSALALAVSIGLAWSPAWAQSGTEFGDLLDRIERLEAILGQGSGSIAPPDGDPASAAALSMRIGELEDRMRHLNGQVEELAHVVRRIEDGLERLSEDSEYRFQSGDAGSSRFDSRQPDGSRVAQGQPRLTEESGYPPPGRGEGPQILGQIPSQPLDLSPALDEGVDQSRWAPSDDAQAGQPLGGAAGDQARFAALPMSGNSREDYDRAYGHILRGDFEMAEQSLRQFLSVHADDELAGSARYWLGESLFARGRYRDAADEFLGVYTDYPASPKAADSLFKLGLSLKELGERDAACATLSEISQEYPDAPRAVRERARSEMDKSDC